MATVISGNQVKLNNGQVVSAQQGGWYDGQQFWGGSLSAPGQIHSSSNQQGAGQAVSNDVIAQTNPNNVSYIQAQKLQSGITPAYSTGANASYVGSLNAEVEKARKALQDTLKQQKQENDTKLAELRATEKQALDQVGELTTPFREELENAERERLYINKNFEANQALIDELDLLLTEGNEYIRQQKEVTGLASVRNPRIQKAMEDVAARVGVIEAVINARNGQIAQAYTLIDRSITAITNDRLDRLTYYETILKLADRDIIRLEDDNKRIAQEQVNILKNDLDRANAIVDYVKQLMVNPETAGLMGDAGISLNDSIETINQKLSTASYNRELREMMNSLTLEGAVAVYDPSSVPASQLVSFTDSRGQTHYFKTQPKAASSGDIASEFYKTLGGGTSNKSGSGLRPPQYTPKKIPTIIVDENGIAWEYTAQGWRLA